MENGNTVVRLVRRPEGRLAPDIFSVEEEPLAPLADGEFRLRVDYLAMDPALLSRMRDEDNYTAGVSPGDVMQANGVGAVVESRNADARVGETRAGQTGMQAFATLADAGTTRVVDAAGVEARWYLGVLGTTGMTALLALEKIGDLKPGETVLISSGGSMVGSIAAQLAKRQGCRVVGIVSTAVKAQQIIDDWGYDAALPYRGRSVDDMAADIGNLCPDGVDVYLDNTGGDITEAVLDRFNPYARHIVTGRVAVAHLKDTKADIGRRDQNVVLVKRLRKQGFVVLDHLDERARAEQKLRGLIDQGAIRFREDIVQGIEHAPAAFFRMVNGESRGKQLVAVRHD